MYIVILIDVDQMQKIFTIDDDKLMWKMLMLIITDIQLDLNHFWGQKIICLHIFKAKIKVTLCLGGRFFQGSLWPVKERYIRSDIR